MLTEIKFIKDIIDPLDGSILCLFGEYGEIVRYSKSKSSYLVRNITRSGLEFYCTDDCFEVISGTLLTSINATLNTLIYD